MEAYPYNDPLNGPADRGITAKLYDAIPEIRLLQEMVLGIGGWRALEALGIPAEVCHLNEGHAAFAVLERARGCMRQTGHAFPVAWWATRAGTVFTTHTPVAAGFDAFPNALIRRYFREYVPQLGISLEQLLALGRWDPHTSDEPFNMAILALRGSIAVNGVSRLHGAVSRRLFQPLFPRWPTHEVPIGAITNGVHMPSWDSAWADTLWTECCGQGRWIGNLEGLPDGIRGLSDGEVWAFRTQGCQALVHAVRQHLAQQLRQSGAEPETVQATQQVLDPHVLTVGFARRFTAYKRPHLLLHDPDRLTRLLIGDPVRGNHPPILRLQGFPGHRDGSQRGISPDVFPDILRLFIHGNPPPPAGAGADGARQSVQIGHLDAVGYIQPEPPDPLLDIDRQGLGIR